MTIEKIAEVCHNTNSALCKCFGEENFGNWDNAPEWKKQSAIEGVKFRMENPTCSPQQQHEQWMSHKIEQGWSYGSVKDEAKKEHPCLVEYENLPMEQRCKDYVFQAIVDSLLAI